jgi:hypothetical protein
VKEKLDQADQHNKQALLPRTRSSYIQGYSTVAQVSSPWQSLVSTFLAFWRCSSRAVQQVTSVRWTCNTVSGLSR